MRAMNEPAWEYCQLLLIDSTLDAGKLRCTLAIRYFGGDSRMLSRAQGDDARLWESNPWGEAIARLGEAGWELVSVQHANTAGDMGAGGEMSNANVVAYFKRRKVEGRSVDEPELRLE